MDSETQIVIKEPEDEEENNPKKKKKKLSQKQPFFEDLPIEILNSIVKELTLDDICNFMEVCKFMHSFIVNKKEQVPLKHIKKLLEEYYPNFTDYFEKDRLYYFLENCISKEYQDLKEQSWRNPLSTTEGRQIYTQYLTLTDHFILSFPELIGLFKNYRRRKYINETGKRKESLKFLLKEELHLIPTRDYLYIIPITRSLVFLCIVMTAAMAFSAVLYSQDRNTENLTFFLVLLLVPTPIILTATIYFLKKAYAPSYCQERFAEYKNEKEFGYLRNSPIRYCRLADPAKMKKKVVPLLSSSSMKFSKKGFVSFDKMRSAEAALSQNN